MPVLGEHWVVVMQGSVPGAELAGLEGKGFLQAQPCLVDVTHSMKLLWTLSKSTLNHLHGPLYPQSMCGSQSTFLGNLPFLCLQEMVSDTGVETPLDTGGASYTWGGCTSNPEVKLQSSPQSQMGIKAKHLIAWQILYHVHYIFICNYWRRYKKSSRTVF